MKTLIPVLCAVAVLAGCVTNNSGVDAPKPVAEAPKVVVDWDQLEGRDGVHYFEEKPFTGIAVRKKEWEVPFKDGKQDGLGTYWHENGQKSGEYTYKDGKTDGLQTVWYKNGQKGGEGTYKNGKLITGVGWKPNGEKCPVSVINGNGVEVWYNDDGTEGGRRIYKDGEQVLE